MLLSHRPAAEPEPIQRAVLRIDAALPAWRSVCFAVAKWFDCAPGVETRDGEFRRRNVSMTARMH